MSTEQPAARKATYDRAYLLGEAKRNDLLALWEVERYGQDSFGDPEYVSIYGLKPEEWYARGVRLLGRTVVECTRDRLADLMGRDIAAVAGSAGAGSVVVDPFAGSANTLQWIRRHVPAGRAVGFELDDAVFAATRENLAILDLDIELVHQDHEAGLASVRVLEQQLVIAFVAPPWGDALSARTGLDLRRTSPPVSTVIDLIARTFGGHRVLVAAQVHETVVASSITAATSRCEWSSLTTYDIDPPGRNHGLLLATLGWTP
jgi:hypothetical protein